MDEPLSGLDANLRVRLLAAIRSIQRELAVTACYVTHDQEEALGVADRVVVMREGRILQRGTPEEIYTRPKTAFVAGFVGLSSLLDGTVADGRAKTALGEFPANGASEGPVRLAVRPESVKIEAGAPLAATVESCAFRGDRWLVALRTAECELLSFAGERPAIGEEVRLRIDPAPVPVENDEVSR
jgi:ABC-type Fe3+/spermidine/putrescine transport system ATPase subunit